MADWRRRGDEDELGPLARAALAAVVVPLVMASSFLLYLVRGGPPRIGGAISSREREQVRRALRQRLRDLEASKLSFRLSEVMPFRWQRVGIVDSFADPRLAFTDLDPSQAKALPQGEGELLLVERAPGQWVHIRLWPDYSLVCKNGILGPGEIIVSPVAIAGVRHLQFAAEGSPAPAPFSPPDPEPRAK